jgi:hypothetical protein
LFKGTYCREVERDRLHSCVLVNEGFALRASSSTKDLLCFRFDSRWPTYLPTRTRCLRSAAVRGKFGEGGEARRGVYVELALVRGDVDVDVDVDVV